MQGDYQIIDSIEASIYWKDLEGKYLGCNQYMVNMAGLERSQIVGHTDYELPWKNQADAIRDIDKLVINNCKRYEVEEKAFTNEGIVKVYLSSKTPLVDKNNQVIGLIGASIDITNFKLLEKEFAKTEQMLNEHVDIKKRFLKNISHESRIPLSSVVSLSESLKDGWDRFDDQFKRETVDLIVKESQRLSKFVLDTFDTSSFLQNTVILNLKQANFSKFLRSEVTKYKQSLFDSNVKIQINSFENHIFAFDKTMISRVIKNLLMNAVQFSPGDKNITINLYKSHLKNIQAPAIHCCIKDEGVGVPEKEFKSIFNPFSESTRTASKAKGVGLGLSVCRDIIEAHSGAIWVENNNPLPGSTFNFMIPTNLFSIITDQGQGVDEDTKAQETRNILNKELGKIYQKPQKHPFALIGISCFNSYFSKEKILEIIEWVNSEYENFALFVPDQISRYTFIALGYSEDRSKKKVTKQDNYTINKIQDALSIFYQKNPTKQEISVYKITELIDLPLYQNLYNNYYSFFITDKDFRQSCFSASEAVLLNNSKKSEHGSIIDDFQKNIAAQYFLLELPIMSYASEILDVESCDFIYHNIPDFFKNLSLSKYKISPKQRFVRLT